MTVIVLGSGSPSRLALLRRAGLDPVVEVSGVDETEVAGETPAELTTRLAKAKATAVAVRFDQGIIIGCDSMLEFGGIAYGKPKVARSAVELWRQMAGGRGIFHTGHCLIDAASGRITEATCATTVSFSRLSDAEITAYVASGEPLQVAGGFKIDHRGGWFVDRVEGEPSNLQGLSLPLLRRLLAELGVSLTQAWAQSPVVA